MLRTSWYALYTAPRSERIAERRLKEAGIETYLPLHLAPRQWSDRIKLIEVPLFSSYIFVRSSRHLLGMCIKIPCVLRIIYHNGQPAIVRDSEITAIREFLESARAKELRYDIEEQVLIACGPLKNISGQIIRIKKDRLLLCVKSLGLTVSVKADQIKKIKRI